MASSLEHLPTTGRSSDDLTGLDVLLVEDSWDVRQAVKALLELCGATVAGPAATIADAELLLAHHLPDVAIVDLHLRGGERSDSLIGRLREQGVPIIMFSGSFELASLQAATTRFRGRNI
jgi:CheY-like chemotaxis protein